ncbi:MAG: enoyl-CoA hydratase/isomerase family protein [Beijerinckiaceae bacterium]
MADAEVIVQRENGVLWVTIDRPEKRNPLSRSVLSLLRTAFEEGRDEPDLRLAVLTAAGDKSFAAGGDLREVRSILEPGPAGEFSDEAHAALDAVRRFPLPVIAAVNGDALGGGAELSVACDIRILAAHARIGFVQGRINVSTSWGGGTDLMRLVGYGRALSLLSRSAMIGGAEAVAYGLAEAVAPEGEPFAEFVDRFIAPMRRQTALVMRGFKAQAITERFAATRDESRQVERDFFVRTWVHDDHWRAADKVLAPAG